MHATPWNARGQGGNTFHSLGARPRPQYSHPTEDEAPKSPRTTRR